MYLFFPPPPKNFIIIKKNRINLIYNKNFKKKQNLKKQKK